MNKRGFMFIIHLESQRQKGDFIMSKAITKKIKLGILSLSALGLLAACADDPVMEDPATDPAVEDPAVMDPADDPDGEDIEDPATDPVEEEDAGDDAENGA